MKRFLLVMALVIPALARQDERGLDERGAEIFAAKCAGCHGGGARGLTVETDLMRSTAVRTDQTGPVLRAGHPKANPVPLSEPEQADIAAWLHARVQAVADRDVPVSEHPDGRSEKGPGVLCGDMRKVPLGDGGSGGNWGEI